MKFVLLVDQTPGVYVVIAAKERTEQSRAMNWDVFMSCKSSI